MNTPIGYYIYGTVMVVIPTRVKILSGRQDKKIVVLMQTMALTG